MCIVVFLLFIVVLPAKCCCFVCEMSLFCLRNVVVQPAIFHRSPNAIRTDTVRRPIRLRTPPDQIAFAVRSDGVRSPMAFA